MSGRPITDAQRLAVIAEGSGIGTWEWNIQTGETHFNDRWAEMIGFTIAELAPISIDTWYAIVHPDDRAISEALLERHFDGLDDYYDARVRVRRRDGNWLWVRDVGRVLTWTDDGRPEWMYGTHTDVHAETVARMNAERRERNYASFFEASPSPIWVVSGDGRILSQNSRAASIGVGGNALPPATLAELFASGEGDLLTGPLTSALATGTASAALIMDAGQRTRLVNVSISRGEWNGETALFVAAYDPAEEIRADRTYAAMVVSSSAMLVLVDLERGIGIDANSAFLSAMGIDRDAFVGRAVTGAAAPIAALLGPAVDEIRAVGLLAEREVAIEVAAGKPKTIALSGARLEDQARPVALLTGFDVTARVSLLAERAEAVEHQRRLMQELNHRVKNNLAMVASLVRLKGSELGEDCPLDDLDGRIQAIAAVHEQLQAEGSQTFTETTIGPYLERIVRHVLPSSSTPVQFTMDGGDFTVPTRSAVPLGLILNELVTNAIKYGFGRPSTFPMGLVNRLSLHIARTERADGTARMTMRIANSGARFPEKVDFAASPSLGLQLVHSLVSQLAGTAELTRDPHTSVRIDIPI